MSVRFPRGTPLVWAGLLVTTGACSVIYDADVFDNIDPVPVDAMRQPDAPVPDAPVPDADPTRLALERLDPPDVFEGMGCIPVDGGCRSDSRPVPIVIAGANIMPGATVTLNGPGLDAVSPDLVVNADGTQAAFALSVPVLPDLGNGALGSIEVVVSQGGISESIVLPVRGLDDFVASVDAPEQTFAVTSLRSRYARVVIDAPVTFTGQARVKFDATAEIVVGAAVHVDGRNGSGTNGGAGGPGGCTGGNAGANGTCDGGGKAGGGTDGGGGGGHAESGAASPGGAAGGIATGSAFLTPLAPAGAATSRGHGGGGGGSNCLANAGGGGGGGGSLELTSGGALRLTATALLSAKGGNGAPGQGGLCGGGSAGGGGGGSGGAVLVRAALAFDDEGADTRVNVDPGTGGGDDGGTGNDGGGGAPGRVRFDLPGDIDTPAAFAGVTHRYRGPVWDPASPVVTTEPEHMLRLFGGPSETVFIDIEGQSRRVLAFPDDGVLEVQVNLVPGQSEICARVTDGPHANQPDAANCFDIAYIRLP